MRKLKNIVLMALLCYLPTTLFAQILVEAESFSSKGGWVVDQQRHVFVRQYLLRDWD